MPPVIPPVFSPPGRMSGLSLIEVLVTLLLVAVAATGFVALALQSERYVSDAAQRSSAQWLALDLVERIRSNPAAWPQGFSVSSSDPSGDCSVVTPCTDPAQLALHDLQQVEALASRNLAQGLVAVRQPCSPGEGLPCVAVAWGGGDPVNDCDSAAPAGSSASQCVLLRFWPGRLP